MVKGTGGVPLACPHIGQVMAYDQAIRDLQPELMKTVTDFQKALEQAMADHDTRMLHFTTPFGMEANTQACKALTAPGLNEIYGIGATTYRHHRPSWTSSGPEQRGRHL